MSNLDINDIKRGLQAYWFESALFTLSVILIPILVQLTIPFFPFLPIVINNVDLTSFIISSIIFVLALLIIFVTSKIHSRIIQKKLIDAFLVAFDDVTDRLTGTDVIIDASRITDVFMIHPITAMELALFIHYAGGVVYQKERAPGEFFKEPFEAFRFEKISNELEETFNRVFERQLSPREQIELKNGLQRIAKEKRKL